jgi:hypothetical protein
MPQGTSHGESSQIRLTYWKPLSHKCMADITTHAIPSSSPITKSKPLKPASFYLCIFTPYLLPIQEMDSHEHIVFAWRLSARNLYNMCLLTTFSAKSDLCIYVDTWKRFLNFSDYIMRLDNSSLHGHWSYRPYQGSRLQTEWIVNWSARYCPASYTQLRQRNLNSR